MGSRAVSEQHEKKLYLHGAEKRTLYKMVANVVLDDEHSGCHGDEMLVT